MVVTALYRDHCNVLKSVLKSLQNPLQRQARTTVPIKPRWFSFLQKELAIQRYIGWNILSQNSELELIVSY